MGITPVSALKAGMTIGNERRALYTVTSDAKRGAGGSVSVEIDRDGQKDTLTWLHGDHAQVHVR